jgi:5'-methylthioadenosine phosphorylase
MHDVTTPFGKPSAPIVVTEVEGVPVALLQRHGEGHRFNPSQVPYRANIFALKALGVTQILSSAAVGSLREEIAPRHLVIPDQVIDRTHRRPSTFFDELAVHVELAAPFCSRLRALFIAEGAAADTKVHPKGTYVVMEGPQFSTRAESELHRSWGADLIGMTVMPEAKLAREAELCYAQVSLPTDYDCWRPAPADVDSIVVMEEIIKNLQAATQHALALIRRTVKALGKGAGNDVKCACGSALKHAIWTDKATLPPETLERLRPLIGKYVG